MDGIFLLNKPVDKTSREMCNEIGRLFHTKKVGHVGTLDPFASGLLIIAVNKATKAVTFFDESVKEYEADISLGTETDTLDNTGKVIKKEQAKKHSESEIKETLKTFLGDISQTPPMTSAIRVNGKRLYEYAHEGKEVDRPSRTVHIYELELLNYDENSNLITIRAKVSKGTYIRTLGSDIAKKLGNIAHLSRLVRIGVSPFDIKETSTIEEIKSGKAKVYSVYDVLSRLMKCVEVDETKVNDIKNGKYTYLDLSTKEDRILIIDHNHNAIAVYELSDNNRYKFVRGMF